METGLHRFGLEDMPQELLQRLCAATDRQGNGLCDINKLTGYLGRASPRASNTNGTLHGQWGGHGDSLWLPELGVMVMHVLES